MFQSSGNLIPAFYLFTFPGIFQAVFRFETIKKENNNFDSITLVSKKSILLN